MSNLYKIIYPIDFTCFHLLSLFSPYYHSFPYNIPLSPYLHLLFLFSSYFPLFLSFSPYFSSFPLFLLFFLFSLPFPHFLHFPLFFLLSSLFSLFSTIFPLFILFTLFPLFHLMYPISPFPPLFPFLPRHATSPSASQFPLQLLISSCCADLAGSQTLHYKTRLICSLSFLFSALLSCCFKLSHFIHFTVSIQ